MTLIGGRATASPTTTTPARQRLRVPLDARVAGWAPGPAPATGMIALATIAMGFVPFFARRLSEHGMAPAAVAFHRYAITAVLMAAYLRLDRARRRLTMLAMLSGFAMGFGWIAYVRAVERADVATVGVVYMTYPLFTLIAARVLFGVRATPRSLIGGLLVLVAAAVPLAAGAADGAMPWQPLLIAFLAPLSFGFAIAVLTDRLGALTPFERMAGVTSGALIGLAPLVLQRSPSEVLPTSVGDLGLVLGIGIVTTLVPMTAFAIGAPIVGAARSATTGALELPTIFLIGSVLLGEALRVEHVVAGAIVLCAVAVSPVRSVPAAVSQPRRRRRARPDASGAPVTGPTPGWRGRAGHKRQPADRLLRVGGRRTSRE